MVTSYVETLVERLTGVEKAVPDRDGDYPVRYRKALYYVRILPREEPIVQVFSIALDGVESSDALMHALNRINADLSFCRVFWVRGQVLFEAEHLGTTLDDGDFRSCAMAVATATDFYSPQLAEEFGGRLAFDESKEEDYRPPAADESPDRGGYL